MKAGIVKHLNARPLTLAFEERSDFTCTIENPSLLIEVLKNSELDFALVSSVEILRNSLSLAYCPSVGVFAKKQVRSILFFEKLEGDREKPILVDSGSRSSVALLQCLFFLENKKIPKMIPTPASEIAKLGDAQEHSFLLFGDHALLAEKNLKNFRIKDLATEWYSKTNTSFAFAYWAYPRDKRLPDKMFEEALEYGKSNLSKIIAQEKRFPENMVYEYFTKDLLFESNADVENGFALFQKVCKEAKLL